MIHAIPTRREGFSLIELLVSLAVVSVLLTLSIGGVKLAGEAAKTTQCTSNLRQVCAGLLASVAERDGRFPWCVEKAVDGQFSEYWSGDLLRRKYVSDYRVFFCPKQVDRYYLEAKYVPRFQTPGDGVWGYTSYGIGRASVSPMKEAGKTVQPARLARITEPSKLIILAEAYAPSQLRDGWYNFIGSDLLNNGSTRITPRHGQDAVVAYGDGHVGKVSVEELKKSTDTSSAPWFESVYIK